MFDIGSMPAIVSINIYTYHVNQNSPVPRGQGKESEVGEYAEAVGAAEKTRSSFFQKQECIPLKWRYPKLKDSYIYMLLAVFVLFYFFL